MRKLFRLFNPSLTKVTVLSAVGAIKAYDSAIKTHAREDRVLFGLAAIGGGTVAITTGLAGLRFAPGVIRPLINGLLAVVASALVAEALLVPPGNERY